MKWTEAEIELLRKYYINEGEAYLSKLINKSPNAIRIKSSREKIHKLAFRKKIKLLDHEKQIMLGSLLGDMHCRLKGRSKNAIIEEAHCEKQWNYMLWKVFVLSSLEFNLRKTKLNALFAESKSYPCLNYYYKLFYKKGKKQISEKILFKIEAIGLAVWYMDDGSYAKRDNNCNLHTNGFTYEENKIIKRWFENKWKIYPKIYVQRDHKNYPGKRWYFLNFRVSETKKLVRLIKNYIHPSMSYKIGVFN